MNFSQAPLARWSVLGVVALLAGALLVTAGTTFVSVRDASTTLVRGQADAFQRSIRSRLFQWAESPTPQDLEAILQEESEAGLRYIAFVDRSTRVEAGQALSNAVSLPRRSQSEEPAAIGNRIRLTFGIAAHRAFRREGQVHPGLVVIEFEPLQATALRADATRTFAAGAISASALLALALELVRRVLRREALERRLERDRRLASLGEMSAVLAHEIRNPLASLKGNAQLLAQGLPPEEKSRQRADRVVEEAVRLESLTNDLLDYVRTGQLQRQSVDPAALLREAAAAVSPDIQVETGGAPIRWTLDPDRMRQVLVNLLQNAVQAGPPVRASVAGDRTALTFEVQDRGPGVAADDRDRIFEPFYTQRTRGTGLGLAVVRRVVELHGGRVMVTEGPGGGALFRVQLTAP